MRHQKIMAAILAVSLFSVGNLGVPAFANAVAEQTVTVSDSSDYVVFESVVFEKVGMDDDGTLLLSADHPSFKTITAISFPTEVDGTPVSVVSIADAAFASCTNLTEVTIPDSITAIPEQCFYNCTSLKKVTLPESITTIGEYAFANCETLEEINLPDSLHDIPRYAFGNTKILTDQEGQEMQYIDHWAVQVGTLADDATSVTFEEGTVGIASYLLQKKSNITSVTLPDSVKHIGSYAFYQTGLTGSLELPKNLVNIEECAFGFTSIDAVTFPDTLEYIGQIAFTTTPLETLSIPASVKEIDQYAFQKCESLKTVEIAGAETIGTAAFVNDTALEQITLPDTLTTIGKTIFYNCTSLNHVTIPEGVTELGENVFRGCTSLDDITIPDTLRKIGANAFTDTALWDDTEESLYLGNWFIGNRTKQTEVTLKEGTIGIAGNALSEVGDTTNTLQKVTLPDGLKYLGDGAFNYCQNLTEINFPETLKTIGEDTFGYCKGLTNVTIPASVTEIDRGGLNTMGESITILSPKLRLRDDKTTLNATTIYGLSDTAVESYCTAFEKNFVSIGTCTAYKTGDATGDGVIDVSDAVLTLTIYAKQAAGVTIEESDAAIYAADVNGDGVVEVSDAVAILTYYAKTAAGLEPSWNEIVNPNKTASA